MQKTISPLQDNLQAMLPLVDKDSDAFTEYLVREGGREGGRERGGGEGLREKGLHAQRKINHSLAHSPLPPSLPLPSLTHNAPSLTAHSCWPHLHTLATHGNIQTMCDSSSLSARLCQRENPLPPPCDNPSQSFPPSLPLPPSLPSLSSLSLLSPHPSLLQVGVRTLDAGIRGAYYNILTNLVTDSSYATSVREEAARLAGESTDKCLSLLDTIQLRLEAAAQKSGGGAT